MSPRKMDVVEIGSYYELKREQWNNKTAKISLDPSLLEEVKKYTWTCTNDEHPYLVNSSTSVKLHEFVLFHIYGRDQIKQMQAAGNIIEHLDNDGLNCTYENLHILSSDMNKAKAFSIDRIGENLDSKVNPLFILDVYYNHNDKYFQLQIFMNDNIYFNRNSMIPIEIFICKYNSFNDLFTDWFYLLNSVEERFFDVLKLHANLVLAKERPCIELTPEEAEQPMVCRDGVWYLNLDAGTTFVNHTAMRQIINNNNENE